MPVNQYYAFAVGAGANALSPGAYAALTTLIGEGFQTGTANSTQMNTVWRQTSVAAAGLGEFITTYGPNDALDDGDPVNFSLALKAAIDSIIGATAFWTTGMTVGVFGDVVPPGFLEMNGAFVSRTTYAALWAFLGSPNTGDGVMTFTLPECRGEFFRGWDHGRGVDPGRGIGTTQSDDIKAHTHSGFRGQAVTNGSTGSTGGDNPFEGLTGSTGGTETRPRNVAVMWCIKF